MNKSDSDSQSRSFEANDEQRTIRFTRLYAANEHNLRALIFAILPDADVVEEVLQQTALVLWRKFDDLKNDEGFLRWSSAVARFEVLAFRRSRARDRLRFDNDLVMQLSAYYANQQSNMESRRKALASCLQTLIPKDLAIIKQVYGERMKIREVAESAGKSPDAFYKIVRRIRQKLFKCVEMKLRGQQ